MDTAQLGEVESNPSKMYFFERLETPRVLGKDPGLEHTCIVMHRQPSCVPRRRTREKLQSDDGTDNANVQKNTHFVHSTTNYYGKYFERLFLSSTGISDAKNENHPLWDHKSSLFLGSEIIKARNN